MHHPPSKQETQVSLRLIATVPELDGVLSIEGLYLIVSKAFLLNHALPCIRHSFLVDFEHS